MDEDFSPKSQLKNTAQTALSRKIIEQFAKRRSDWEGLKQLAFHVSIMLLSAALVFITNEISITKQFVKHVYMLYILAQLLYGWTMSFLFMGEHECVHQTAFKSAILNDVVAYVYGFCCFRPPLHYRYYHWAHHRFTGNKEKDPELQNTFIDFDIGDSPLHYLFYMSGIPFWIDRITGLLRHSLLFVLDQTSLLPSVKYSEKLLPNQLEYYLQSPRRRHNVSMEAFCFVTVYISISLLADPKLLWLYWILPSLIGQIFLRGYLIAEHRNCASTSNMFSNTRTTQTFWLESKLAWNMPWHLEHHAFPYVPFYLLPGLHEKLADEVGDESEFYARSGCEPNGRDGYLSMHKRLLSDFVARDR